MKGVVVVTRIGGISLSKRGKVKQSGVMKVLNTLETYNS